MCMYALHVHITYRHTSTYISTYVLRMYTSVHPYMLCVRTYMRTHRCACMRTRAYMRTHISAHACIEQGVRMRLDDESLYVCARMHALHVHMHAYITIQPHHRMHADLPIIICSFIDTYVHAHACAHACARRRTCMHMHAHIAAQAYTRMHALHVHTHPYIHTYIQPHHHIHADLQLFVQSLIHS
jgi:hypothetical protein